MVTDDEIREARLKIGYGRRLLDACDECTPEGWAALTRLALETIDGARMVAMRAWVLKPGEPERALEVVREFASLAQAEALTALADVRLALEAGDPRSAQVHLGVVEREVAQCVMALRVEERLEEKRVALGAERVL